ncbi:g10479 [Coccomyxa elongata]
MFWWLETCVGEHRLENKEAPLVIWLQGGPGASGTGYGNFQEVGPYDVGWKPRKHSWVEKVSILFVDNPVGTGFSYVEDGANFTHNNAEIAADLLTFLKSFLNDKPEYIDTPLHIVSESYGGKMAAELARAIVHAQETEDLKVNFRGVALGDSWISPVDYVLAWTPFLKAWSLLEDVALANVSQVALRTQQAVGNGNLTGATALWALLEETISNATDNVDWYNALLHNVDGEDSSVWLSAAPTSRLQASMRRLLARYHNDALSDFMNGSVRKRVGIIPDHVSWGGQSAKVFEELSGDFMVDVIKVVDDLLASGVPVTVYNGQLDLICCTLGTDAWMDQLKWKGLRAFQAASPEPFYVKGDRTQTAGFFKAHKNLAMYIVLNAGHMIPSDQPKAALLMLEHIMSRGERVGLVDA